MDPPILLQVECSELPLNFVDIQFPLENNLGMNQSFQEWYSFDTVGFFERSFLPPSHNFFDFSVRGRREFCNHALVIAIY